MVSDAGGERWGVRTTPLRECQICLISNLDAVAIRYGYHKLETYPR